MIAWVLWFFLALHLFLLDGFLVGVSQWFPDLSLTVALFCVLYARPSALPGILICAALSRSVLLDGSAASHLLILGLPVAVLLPLRVVFSKTSVLWQCLASGFLAFMMPRLTGLLFRVTGEGVLGTEVSSLDIFVAMCVVPVFTWLLRSLPPLSMLQESRQ